ncbi:hypothetical protein PLANPX_1709 [Lacipirellula parvula]|uniref:Uncharacterized protein n=1 Tax=Lacipirellula parvula TaxID=2650471 RepID=A0A5K7X8E6_9BACT|nr:hypothetical protein PLANPX_1709 [Lacipirellula parvula]
MTAYHNCQSMTPAPGRYSRGAGYTELPKIGPESPEWYNFAIP